MNLTKRAFLRKAGGATAAIGAGLTLPDVLLAGVLDSGSQSGSAVAVDELYADWRVTWVTGTELSNVLPVASVLRVEPDVQGNGLVRVALAGPATQDLNAVDWDCDLHALETPDTQVAFLKGRFKEQFDPHEHEVTIACMLFPTGGRSRGQMLGYVRHPDPAIPHLTGGWHAEH